MEASQKQMMRKRTARSDTQSIVFSKMRFLTATCRRSTAAVFRRTAVTETGSGFSPGTAERTQERIPPGVGPDALPRLHNPRWEAALPTQPPQSAFAEGECGATAPHPRPGGISKAAHSDAPGRHERRADTDGQGTPCLPSPEPQQ